MSRKRGDNGGPRTPGVARACHHYTARRRRPCEPPGSIKRSDRMCLLAGNKHGARYRQMAGPLPTTVPAAPSTVYYMKCAPVMKTCDTAEHVGSAAP